MCFTVLFQTPPVLELGPYHAALHFSSHGEGGGVHSLLETLQNWALSVPTGHPLPEHLLPGHRCRMVRFVDGLTHTPFVTLGRQHGPTLQRPCFGTGVCTVQLPMLHADIPGHVFGALQRIGEQLGGAACPACCRCCCCRGRGRNRCFGAAATARRASEFVLQMQVSTVIPATSSSTSKPWSSRDCSSASSIPQSHGCEPRISSASHAGASRPSWPSVATAAAMTDVYKLYRRIPIATDATSISETPSISAAVAASHNPASSRGGSSGSCGSSGSSGSSGKAGQS